MTRFKIIIEYDGTHFSGWQRQKDACSVQEKIEDALFKLTGCLLTIHAAGRTDAGVHACGQVVHVDIDKPLQGFQIQQALNAFLRPYPISIIEVKPISNEFHARFSARMRHYQYRIVNRSAALALDLNRAWLVHKPLDIVAMQQASCHFIGTYDFTSFRATECQALNAVRTISTFTVNKIDDNIYFDIASKSFLHHQVRNIVGTLKLVGEGRFKVCDIPRIIQAHDRRQAGPTAPANGLTFIKVDY